MNECEDVEHLGGDPAYLWFFENLTWKHLDEIPDEILHKVLKSYHLSGHCVQIIFSGIHCNPEDPEQLVNVINRLKIIGTAPFRIFRSWIYLETARRLDGSFNSLVPDVLVREMATDARALEDNDPQFWARVKKTVGALKPPEGGNIPMKNVAVICCIYNNYRVAKEAVEEAARRSTCLGQLILIDNHGLDPDLRPWINSLAIGECLPSGIPQKADHITVLDAGENLGCHRGFNHGFQHLLPEIEYVVKLDDDTFIRTDCWDELMRSAMAVKKIAFLSADIDPEAKQKNKYIETTIDGMRFEIAPDDAIVGFSCVMFRKSDLSKWGPMRGAHEQPDDKGLYGGEEAYFANMARQQGLSIAHFPDVYCDHAKNHDRHPDYPMWKWVYGYRRWTNQGMDKWLEDAPAVLSQFRRRLMEEIRGDPINLEFVEYVVGRIEKRGNSVDSKRLLELAQTPRIAAIANLHDILVKASAAIDKRA